MNIITLPYTDDAQAYFKKLQDLSGCVWLDSGYPDCQIGRYDIISAMPTWRVALNSTEEFLHLTDKLQNQPLESDLPFCGGWIGHIPFAFAHDHFRITTQREPARFGWYTWALIIDHQSQNARLFFNADCSQDLRRTIEAKLDGPTPDPLPFQVSAFQHDLSKTDYLQAVNKINEYLLAGDCYQVNFAQRFSAQFSGSTGTAYRVLRQAVPSPFSAYLALEGTTLLSISPERYLSLRGDRAFTQPIKGTIGRAEDPSLDQCQVNRLINSDKNRAENVMIVDLLRNDLSRFCQPHSVRVTELFATQSFANVHHLVSSIRGVLANDVTHAECVLGCFPGGSISGAPKRRALEIINELEPHSRGPYCGSIGYFSRNGQTDFNIAIRTLQIEQNRILAWAGGGVVADSNAEEEYVESMTKISAFLSSLERHSSQ